MTDWGRIGEGGKDRGREWLRRGRKYLRGRAMDCTQENEGK
jgi:hypothetical protein